ncbi:MAG TPA: type II toxin-antitoxin system PemK/MazF family toxin [Burkholderiales bacterium]|nr:type II toxin-antitoxin system PemK/MazF family toxin [Burkholderiales bacterium]
MRRGEIWWASLPEPTGSGPGFRRPVVIVQADSFNASRIRTAIVAVITSNLRLAEAPGNVLLRARSTRLKRDSVANVSQLITLDRSVLTERIGRLPPAQQQQLDEGLRLALEL